MARRPKSVELPALGALDRTAGRIGWQLAQSLRDAVRRGELKPGEPLPSSRMLSQSLQVARGTVIEAYDQLVAEGFLDTTPGGGTSVAAALPAPALMAKRPAPIKTQAVALAPRAAMFTQIASQFTSLPHAPFAVSVPVGAAAPDDVWRRLGNKVRARGAGAPSSYDDPQGVRVLREAIADYVRRSRSVYCTAEQVIITAGTQQGLYLASQVLLDKEDTAWVEDPGYRGLSAIFDSMGRSRMQLVPVDEEGINVASGVHTAPDARVAFVTPSHQYPLGMPLSMARRSALLSWAAKTGAWIVEDDYDSELRYTGHPFPALQGLAPERVVYLGTFSKILFPSLRIGFAIVPPGLEQAFSGARILMDRHPPSADQHVLAAFMAEGHLDRHIRRVRHVYAQCRARLMELLSRHFPVDLAWLQPGDQGAHHVLWLADGIDDREVVRRAVAQGIALRAVSPMYSSGRERPGLILGFGDFPQHQLEAAVIALVGIVRTVAAQSETVAPVVKAARPVRRR